MSQAERRTPHRDERQREERRQLLRALLPALIAFGLTSLLSPVYSNEPFDPSLWLWQAFLIWPIGACLLVVPATLLAIGVHQQFLFRPGQLILVALATFSMATVAISDDAQKGLAWLIIPWYGSIAMALLVGLQWLLRRAQKSRPRHPGSAQ